MKRFLSLVLSALFVFQLGNASCDAISHLKTEATSKCQDQRPYSVMAQESYCSPYIPKQPSPVINLTTTPQTITVQSPVNIKKVDATTLGDKISGWVKCALWVLLVGGAVYFGGKLLLSGIGSFDSWVDKKIYALIAYLAGGEEQLEKKSKNFVLNMLKDTAKNMKEKKSTDNDTPWYCGKYSPFC